MATRRKKQEVPVINTDAEELREVAARMRAADAPLKKKGKPTPEPTRIDKFQQRLPVLLTERELLGAGDRAAHLAKEAHEAEEARKEADATAKATVKRLQNESEALLATVRDKREYRLVSCERRFDFRLGKVTEIRIDTGEQLEERPMRDDERQTELGLGDDQLDGVMLAVWYVLAPDKTMTYAELRQHHELQSFTEKEVDDAIAELVGDCEIERCEAPGEDPRLRLVRK
jgi:hypothetical protein